jgi:glycosyltransferase involved in cell wall biosynthesis
MHAPTERTHPRIAILLGTHHGERYLADQLKSIALQSWTNWEVWGSDDHSSDATWEILSAYRAEWGDERLKMQRGPARGFCANFLSLACDARIHADLFAFCDQDDLWDTDKLERAVRWHRDVRPGEPALYCGRTRLIDENGTGIGFSPLFKRPVTFRNALVQSIAGGNTMVFNRAARDLLMEAGREIDVQTHDWWTYIVVTGCGGRVYYDPQPAVGYRQHAGNLVGSNASLGGRVRRAVRLLEGRFRNMNDRNLAALRRLRHRMTMENLAILDEFTRARNRGLAGRITGLRRSGVYCHTRLGNIGLAAAAVLKKL